eukprot:1224689-Ditylum_brightwellii.AAC.1
MCALPSSPCPPPLFCTIRAALMYKEEDALVEAALETLLLPINASEEDASNAAKIAVREVALVIISLLPLLLFVVVETKECNVMLAKKDFFIPKYADQFAMMSVKILSLSRYNTSHT